jgi:phosphoribosylanthranilate isomerase
MRLMGRTRIKICGVRDAETARAAAEAGADAIGLVFVPASPRFVTLPQARKIVGALPAFV